ncbi:MAG: hypoxanthine phosphoribosyltransferase [Clostridia bacterium]|jgi:hypoxanthine phosphoribosyltransferase|nr:hypoxanthine phosphoribosyltransferase [Clostridia bacterium]
MHKDVEKILITEAELDAITTRLAAEIDRDYNRPDKHLLLLCILKGSIVFMSDLMKKLKSPFEIDCMRVSSYGAGTVTTGSVHIILDLIRSDLETLDILVIEDIIDSGVTLSYLVDYLTRKGARSIKTCTLLDKPSRRRVEYTPDYVGIEIPDEFVIGYGLDYAEKYRGLPYVGILKPEVYLK